MARGGSYIIGALILALVAAGILVGTDLVDLSQLRGTSAPAIPDAPTALSAPASREAQLVAVMDDAISGGGFAATFAEKDARLWKLASGHQLERFSLEPSGGAFARLSSSTALGQPTVRWEDLGLSVVLPVEISKKYQGRQIEVGIVARMPTQNASDAVNVVFATQQTGNTGWNAFPLSPTFELHTLRWRIPPVEGGYHARPIVVVHADASGGGRAIEVLGIYVKPIR